ncbi:hypothetical protein [Alkalihalobacterium elongatum]|uniref:hypothetical protein n=1 Tax=Alkalihalobacterium elongatum TaxID=2675466 RepID=UPI001C1F6B76|nr:hypothetical protein [Alkalihalobacterium elongatum]
MACVNPDGTLTSSAKALLSAIQDQALTPEDISKKIGQPLFKVRSSLRDMKSGGFVVQNEENYSVSEGARKLLNRS